jgi:glucan phosphoethanolaminetransferase (alkaline phosphatase superfamily)
MLQRIQSVFMFFAALSMIAMLFFPLWEKSDTKIDAVEREYAIMDAFTLRYEQHNTETGEIQLLGTQNTMLISIAAVLAAAVMFFSISRFKNRLTQVKLNALFSLLVAGVLGGTYFYITKANALFDETIPGTILIGFYLPIVAMFNNFLANRFIRKDEKLVRSADRIR